MHAIHGNGGGKSNGGRKRAEQGGRKKATRYPFWIINILILNTLTGPGMFTRTVGQGVRGLWDEDYLGRISGGSWNTGGEKGEGEGRRGECNSELSELSEFPETHMQHHRWRDEGWMEGWMVG